MAMASNDVAKMATVAKAYVWLIVMASYQRKRWRWRKHGWQRGNVSKAAYQRRHVAESTAASAYLAAAGAKLRRRRSSDINLNKQRKWLAAAKAYRIMAASWRNSNAAAYQQQYLGVYQLRKRPGISGSWHHLSISHHQQWRHVSKAANLSAAINGGINGA